MPLPPEFHELARAVNNWGRWGDDDEIGTLNLITDDVVRRAAACVRTGKRFSLAIPLGADGPQTGAIKGRTNPAHRMTALDHAVFGDEFHMNDDAVDMGLQAATHWDSLAHVTYDGRMYNGIDPSTVTDAGAARAGIDKVRTLVSRGVLLDVARARGVARLDGAVALAADDLDAAEALAETRIGSGDVVLLRTGQMQLLKSGDKRAYAAPNPGPSTRTVEWFRARDVAAVATDSLTFEVFPGEYGMALPVHLLHLVEMGLTQGQNFDLETLAEDCADDGVYEFLLDASPQPFVGGLGSPVNPVAIK